MLISVYLHNEYYQTLKTFGNIDDVVNKILDYCYNNEIDITTITNAPSRDGARRVNIRVTHQLYLDDYSTYSPNSTRYSLRKIIYWFIDNAIYEELDWKVINNPETERLDFITKHLAIILDEIGKLQFKVDSQDVEMLREARQIIKSLEARYREHNE